MTMSKAEAALLTRAEILRRATQLVPVLKERAGETEALRRVPDATIADLVESRMMRLGPPRSFGGLDVEYETMFEVGWELGRACGASSWCYSLWTVHSCMVGYWPAQAQEDFFATGPDTLASSSFAPGGSATPCNGGYRVSGQWEFSSGCDAATWAELGANTPDGIVWMLVPRSDYEIVDDWYVSGLSGSGSKDIVVKDAFVPAYRAIEPARAGDGDWTGWDLHREGRYRVPLRVLMGWDLVSPLVGIAQGSTDEFVSRTKATPSRDRGPDSAAIQIRLAEASAEVDAARTLFRSDVREILDKGDEGRSFSDLDRARYLRDKAFISKLCLAAINRLFEASGGHALFLTEAMQRFHRDAHALSHRDLMMLDLAGQNYGRLLLQSNQSP
jgi:alkylation response protein AidB-like acyl-CoA dehydrogenase